MIVIHLLFMRGSRRGDRGSGPPPLENHKVTGLDTMEYHKATNIAYNVGQPSARQRNAIEMAFSGEPMKASGVSLADR